MNEPARRKPLLDQFYREYLEDEVSSQFIANVSQHYTIETLERLCLNGPVISRRSATLALGFLGTYTSNPALGRALLDRDRAVRLLAEHGIRELWFREGDLSQQRELKTIARLNQSQEWDLALEKSNRLIESAPGIAESWNQRAIAQFNLEQFQESLADCEEAFSRNAFHYSSLVGKGHCFLNLDFVYEAVASFESAIEIHPGLESVRTHLQLLKKTL